MQGERHPARLAVSQAREQVLERLSEAFVKDELGLEEFEARVDGAYQASTEVGLQALVQDLAVANVTSSSTELSVVAPPSLALAPTTSRAPGVLSVLGNVERRGRFPVPSGYRATSVLGNIELDLRDVAFPDGVTEIHLRAVLGNIEVIVPPSLPVECEGTGILASFAALSRTPAEGVAGGPVLRILGAAVLGNVEIRTLPRGALLPGERPRALPAKGGEAP